jgi:transmembrane sensor
MKPTPDIVALHETAAEWHLRRQDQAHWTRSDEQDFAAWLEADPRHRDAYARLERTWQDFSGVARPRLASDTVSAQSAGGASHRRSSSCPPSPWWSRRWAPTALAACLLLVAGGWLLYDNTPHYEVAVATEHGQTRTLDLPDGTHVAINMDTHLKVALYPRRREVTLNGGEAFFQVAHAADQPFTVKSGKSEVRVVGTAFDVDAAPPKLIVTVLEGRVEVRPDRSKPDEVAVLTANQGISIDADMVGDWRTGQVAFRRTPLDQVAQTLSRYLARPITLGNARLASVPVSGYASTSSPEAFLLSLPDLIDVRVQRQPNGSYRITGR